MKKILLVSAIVIFFPSGLMADSYLPNEPYVQTSKMRGSCYAKALPDEDDGNKGQTYVYRFEELEDKIVAKFDWYSFNIDMMCDVIKTVGKEKTKHISVVRMEQWGAEHKASDDDLAIAFYLDDKLLKEYSMLDIAGSPDNVLETISHYIVIKRFLGYFRDENDDFTLFVVATQDGYEIVFDVFTGEILSKKKERYYRPREE